MNYLDRICCICLKNRHQLEKLSFTQENDLSYYDKLTVLIPQLEIDEIKEVIDVCEDCRKSIDDMYSFREKCLSNNVKLWTYIKKLRKDINNKKKTIPPLTRINSSLIHKNVDNNDSKLIDFEKIHVKTELMDESESPTNDEQESVSDDPLNIDIKKEPEIPGDNLYTNNSMINSVKDVNTYGNIKQVNNPVPYNGNTIPNNGNILNNQTYIILTPVLYNTNLSQQPENTLTNHPPIQPAVASTNKIDEPTNSTTSDKTQSKKKRFKCKLCNKSYNRSNYLDIHLRTHTGHNPYKCEICGESFIKKYAFKMHIRSHNGETSHKCEVCDKTFTHSSTLNQHVKINTGDKPYKCDMCNKSFTYSSDLTRHNRIHTGEKPYKCEVCNKSFTHITTLSNHTRIHTGEKPYKCDVCEKTFNHISALNDHNNRKHTDEKLNKCEVCKKSFKVIYDLKKHMRIHTGEKLYKCDVCDKTFLQKSQLTAHSKNHK